MSILIHDLYDETYYVIGLFLFYLSPGKLERSNPRLDFVNIDGLESDRSAV